MYNADLRQDVAIEIDESLDVAVRVEKATFEWEESVAHSSLGGKQEKGEKEKKRHKTSIEKEPEKKEADAAPFRIRDINLTIPRGQLTAIVGPVGSGKVRMTAQTQNSSGHSLRRSQVSCKA